MEKTFLQELFINSLTFPVGEIYILDTVDSTNDFSKKLAEKGAPHGTIIIAGQQTAGRGRMGRRFYSPADTGLYMTLLLRPTLTPDAISLLTPCAAVAVSEAIECLTEKRTAIKWVNDIYIDGKKTAGILTEAAFTPDGLGLAWAAVGIGVNVTLPAAGFPPELTQSAASVFGQEEEDRRAVLAAEILNRFMTMYDRLPERDFYSAYRTRLLQLDKPVQILWGSEKGSGVCIGLDRDFRLLIRRDDGTVSVISSGEVSVRLQSEECE